MANMNHLIEELASKIDAYEFKAGIEKNTVSDENNITGKFREKINAFTYKASIDTIGSVLEIGDGIAQVSGLENAASQELLQFENGTMGIAFNLEKDSIGVILLGDETGIRQGSKVTRTGHIVSIPVGENLLGRVIDPLGNPIDGKGPIEGTHLRPIEKNAPDIHERENVDTPLFTGIKAIDAMIPIGRGQRELIIGDRQTGKTAIAIDTIINQKGKGVFCIYVAIGQKKSSVAQLIQKLEEHGAMEYTTIVVAAADDPAAVQYIAPYAGCAVSEEFMENGQDALVVYDDLTKHAWAYRQISLLLRRPPGREAYPGDVFYLHSRLLERSAKLAKQYVLVGEHFNGTDALPQDAIDNRVYSGPTAELDAVNALEQISAKNPAKILPVRNTGGSSTALPIIETLLGDISAYVPTNVISITDGQIYLESSLFNAGNRPAINVGISVSRVGGSAQTKALKKIAGSLRLDMAQFREVASFAQFGSDLDKSTKQQLDRGKILQELLKQPQYMPYSEEDEAMVIYAGVNGWIDGTDISRVSKWERDFLAFMRENNPDVAAELHKSGAFTPEVEGHLKKALESFKAVRK